MSIFYKIHWALILYSVWVGYDLNEVKEKEIQKKKATLTKITRDIDKIKKNIKIAEKFKAEKDQVEKQFKEVEQEFEAVKNKLPERSSVLDTQNKQMFMNVAEKLNIKKPAISDKEKPKDRGFYLVKNYNFKGVGTFLQFLIFLERIAESERLFNIGSLTLRTGNAPKRGRFQLVDGDVKIETYLYNPNFKIKEEKKQSSSSNKKKTKKRRKKRR